MAGEPNPRWVAQGPNVQAPDGGISALHFEQDSKAAAPKSGEVLVRLVASGVGYTDLLIVRGTYFRSSTFGWPIVPGYDWVGDIIAVGEGVDKAQIGKRVCGLTSIGGFQRYICVRADDQGLFSVPDGLDPAEAVSCVLNYTTAYLMLHHSAASRLKPGCSVLVHSAAGGAGSALVQLARLAGATTVIGTCSASKRDAVMALGATHAVDYKSEDFVEVTKAATNGKGVDIVLDGIGGAHLDRSYESLAPDGFLVAYGMTGAEASGGNATWALVSTLGRVFFTFQLRRLWSRRSATFMGIVVMKEQQPAAFRAACEACLNLLKERKIAPLVDSRVKLEDLRAALTRVQAMQQKGKIVVIH